MTAPVESPRRPRCPECRDQFPTRRAVNQHRIDVHDLEPPHGVTGYSNYGCRCDTCTEANAARQATYRESQGAKPRPDRLLVVVKAAPDPSWVASAACAGVDPQVFFPDLDDRPAVAEAKKVCAGCPVTAECLAEAVTHRDVDTVRAGMTPKERRRHRRTDRPGLLPCPDCGAQYKTPQGLGLHRRNVHGVRAACGTPAGYSRHRTDGEDPCAECTEAFTASLRRLRTEGVA